MSKQIHDCLGGVNCKVKNCKYNCEEKCRADCICINDKNAVTESETCCHTFELK